MAATYRNEDVGRKLARDHDSRAMRSHTTLASNLLLHSHSPREGSGRRRCGGGRVKLGGLQSIQELNRFGNGSNPR